MPQRLEYLGAGADAWRMGNIVEATRRWGEAIRLCRLDGDRQTELVALERHGEALAELGQLAQARKELEAALAVARQLGQPAAQAALAGALGNLAFQAHDLDRAVELIGESLDLARRISATDVVAASSNNLGNVQAARGKLAEATEAYGRADAAAAATGDQPLRATIATNRARVLLRQGDRAGADADLAEAARIVRALPVSHEQVVGLVAIATVSLPSSSGASSGAATTTLSQPLLRQALAGATTLGDLRGMSLAAGTLGESLEATGRRNEAAELAHRAIADAQRVDARDLLWRWEWLNGRLAVAAGDRARAIGAYRRAVATLQSIRLDVPVEYVQGRSSFRDSVGPLYFGLADLLLTEASQTGDGAASTTRLLVESRDIIETFKSDEIRSFFRDPCLARFARPAQEAGPARTDTARRAVLYPILLPRRLEVLVALPDGTMRRATVPVGQAQVEQVARRFRLALERNAGFMEPSRQLYDWIIRPVSDVLDPRTIDTLAVVPDGVLRNIPFAALHDGSGYLVERLAVAALPSLILTDTGDGPPVHQRVLLAGLSEAVQGFSELPGVVREIDVLHEREAGATVLTNEAFNAEAVERALEREPYTILHFATHGVFGSTPAESFILTHGGPFSLDRLETAVKFSQYRDQPLDLLVLSACSTAAGDDRAALGLAGVAVKAGARSAIAALWRVNDQVPARLMSSLYENLSRPSATKAGALRLAQMDMMQDLTYASPSFWAPFVLIGSWR